MVDRVGLVDLNNGSRLATGRPSQWGEELTEPWCPRPHRLPPARPVRAASQIASHASPNGNPESSMRSCRRGSTWPAAVVPRGRQGCPSAESSTSIGPIWGALDSSGKGASVFSVPTGTSVLRQPGFAAEVLDALPDATAILDREGSIVAVNRAWRMFALDNGGRPEATGVGVNYLDVCIRAAHAGCTDAGEVLAGLQAVLSGETVESDREYPCPSPTVGRWFNSRITPIGGATGGAVVSHVNISRRIRSEQDLTHRASHDSLTGLGNRNLFAKELSRALGTQRGRRSKEDVGVLYIDLDGFKAINDTFGHDAGDEVLLNSAHRMRSELRPQDCVARLGGDEFGVCAQRITPEGLAQLALRLEAALATPQQVHGKEVVVGGSVGLHIAAAGESVDEAIRRADQAMYVVKASRHDRRADPSAADLDPITGDAGR